MTARGSFSIRLGAALVGALVLAACQDNALLVDLRTDFLPSREFATVEVRVLDAEGGVREVYTEHVSGSDDFLSGSRVAEVAGLGGPQADLEVALLRSDGEEVVARRLLVEVRGGLQAVTAVITRDCRGVSCEEASGACFNRQCVDPRCSLEDLEACGDAACATSDDCEGGSECASAVCQDSACLVSADDTRCGADEVCSLDRGCVSEDDACPPLELVQHPGGTLSSDEAWGAAEYVLGTTLYVEATLRVAPCSVIRLPERASIEVRNGGVLRLEGAPGAPVHVTGTSAIPGSWERIRIDSGVEPSVIEHAVIEGGGRSGAALQAFRGALVLRESRIHRSAGVGLRAEAGATLSELEGNVFENNGDVGVDVHAQLVDALGPGRYGPNAREGILVRGGTIGRDATWADRGAPYIVNGSITMSTSTDTARLTVTEGVVLLLEGGVSFTAGSGGGIALEGTADAPIRVLSARPEPAPGDWGRFELQSGSIPTANTLRHALLEHGGSTTAGMVRVRSGATLRASASIFRHSAGLGLEVGGTLEELIDCELTHNLRGIEVPASHVANIAGGVFTPNTNEGIMVSGTTLGSDAVWSDLGAPYVLLSSLTLSAGAGGSAALTLAAGVELRINVQGTLTVGASASLRMSGTEDARVRVTSSSPAPAPGDWRRIVIRDTSVGPSNVFDHAIIEYGNYASGAGALQLLNAAQVELNDVVFQNNSTCDVSAGASATITGDNLAYDPC